MTCSIVASQAYALSERKVFLLCGIDLPKQILVTTIGLLESAMISLISDGLIAR